MSSPRSRPQRRPLLPGGGFGLAAAAVAAAVACHVPARPETEKERGSAGFWWWRHMANATPCAQRHLLALHTDYVIAYQCHFCNVFCRIGAAAKNFVRSLLRKWSSRTAYAEVIPALSRTEAVNGTTAKIARTAAATTQFAISTKQQRCNTLLQ